MRDKRENLEQEVLQYKEQVSALQERLDSVTKVRDEELKNIPLYCFKQETILSYHICCLCVGLMMALIPIQF